MCSRKLVVFAISAAVFLAALLTGAPSFDATDGAEFAVCGADLQIAHSPGYPMFLLLVRLSTMLFTRLYGHLRIMNCVFAAASFAVGTAAFRKWGTGFYPGMAGSLLLVTSAPVMSQFNSLEVYPLAILLVLTAMALKDSRLSPYATGMAVFGGHPVAILDSSLFLSLKKKWPFVLAIAIPATLFLYIPVRAASSHTAHYGHPDSPGALISYFTMYTGRLNFPSLNRLHRAVSFIGASGGAVFLILAAFGGKFKLRRDLPSVLSLLFLASYELPDPAGQLWILLLPVALRCSSGIQRIWERGSVQKVLAAALVAVAVFSGVKASDRTQDDAAMRWTTDVLAALPLNSIYRPVAHDTYYAAYATGTLGFRPDILLSDPFGNYFEFSPPGLMPQLIGERTVHVSRAWDRKGEFSLQGLIFSPVSLEEHEIDWNQMAIFGFQGHSPDPMAMDIVSEAWARRMIQEEDPLLADSFYALAVEFAATPVTRRRIEHIREIY